MFSYASAISPFFVVLSPSCYYLKGGGEKKVSLASIRCTHPAAGLEILSFQTMGIG
jgi:hypothetical protein